jgi:hypothetical protein
MPVIMESLDQALMSDGRNRRRLTFSEFAPFAAVLILAVPIGFARQSRSASKQPLPAPTPNSLHRQTVLPIERSPRFSAILVTVLVNEKQAVLILDTGSNTTILSPEITGLNPAALPRSKPPRKGTGFVGDGRWGHATLAIGTIVWNDRRVLVVDTQDLSLAAQRRIDGILGQDILDEFKCVEIDLEKKRLTLGCD